MISVLVVITLLLSISLFISIRLNSILTEELGLDSDKYNRIVEEYSELKKQVDNGALVKACDAKDITNNEIFNMSKVYREEILRKDNYINELKTRIEDVIINADRIAGDRAQNLLDRWKREEEASIRKDAIKRSQNVTKGKVSEHMVPHFDVWPWDPRDARFIGTPLDYIVFEGLSAGNVERIVFVEVKTGDSAKLSKRERQVRDAILAGRVTYEKIHIKDEQKA